MADTMPGDPTARSRVAIPLVLRMLGALAILAVGIIHLDQYSAVYYRVIPVIGPLFLLNLIAATIIGVLLLAPLEGLGDKLRPGAGSIASAVLALAGIGLASGSFIFLVISENTRLFGFQESGYRTAIDLALVAEGAAVLLLAGYLALIARRMRRS